MKLKKILAVLLLIATLFCHVGCILIKDATKEHLEKSDVSIPYNNNISYANFNELKNFVNESLAINNKYYFVLNTEEYASGDLNYEPPRYTFSYNSEENGEYVETKIYIKDYFVKDKNAPRRINIESCDPTFTGGHKWTLQYYYFAYETTDANTPLTFKHFLINDDISRFVRLIRVYQGEKKVGDFVYYAEKPLDSYYEKFLKNNLFIIGGNLNET